MNSKISVVINTLNEEKNLPIALKSVYRWADEIVVVDMHSSDKTVEIAKSYAAKVYFHEKTGYVEPARNYAINKASGEWILLLDADEKVSDKLKRTLKNLSLNNEKEYYRLPRKNIIFGKWIKNSRWWPDYNIRFFKKGMVNWSEVIHSVPETKGAGLDLESIEANALTHYHYKNIEQYIDRMNRYTTFYANNLIKKGIKFDLADLIKRPAGEFFSRYFEGGGYKDGLHGLVLSLLQAVSEFVVYLKVWQSEGFIKYNVSLKSVSEQFKFVRKEYAFWLNDSLYKKTGNLLFRFKKKLKLP